MQVKMNLCTIDRLKYRDRGFKNLLCMCVCVCVCVCVCSFVFLPTLPVYCSHFTLGNPKKLF